MAVNITFDGIMSDEGASPIASCYYQVYFDPVVGSESPVWSDVRQAEAVPAGYYNFNLNDSDILDVDGEVFTGDKVLVAAWTGGAEATRAGLNKTAFVFFVVTLDGSSTYNNDITVYADDDPITDMDGALIARRLTNYTLTNDSHDDHDPGSIEDQKQNYAADAGTIEIFAASALEEVVVDWGDGDAPDTLIGTANGTHQYDDAAGTARTITATAEDARANQDGTPWTLGIDVLARLPVEGLDWTAGTLTTTDLITFNPDITDVDSIVTSVDYSVDAGSTWVETGLGVDENWTYQFSTNGAKTVVQRIYYDDGSGATSDDHNFPLTIANIDPVAGITTVGSDVGARLIVFTSASTDADGTIANYAWVLERSDGFGGWDAEASGTGAGLTTFSYAFTVEDNYKMTLTVTDNDGGTDDFEVEFAITIAEPGSGEVVLVEVERSALPRGKWGR